MMGAHNLSFTMEGMYCHAFDHWTPKNVSDVADSFESLKEFFSHPLQCMSLVKASVLVSSGCYSKSTVKRVAQATEIYYSSLWRLGSPRSGCWLIWFLVRSLFLVCRWKPFCYIFPWQRESEQSLVSLYPYKDTNPFHEDSTFMTSSKPNSLSRCPDDSSHFNHIMTEGGNANIVLGKSYECIPLLIPELFLILSYCDRKKCTS